jgi:hypothetical protein
MKTLFLLIYANEKEKETLSLVTIWINLKDIMLSEISQEQKAQYCIISFICRLKKNYTQMGVIG